MGTFIQKDSSRIRLLSDNWHFQQWDQWKDCYEEGADVEILGEHEENDVHGGVEGDVVLALQLLLHFLWHLDPAVHAGKCLLQAAAAEK